jgi:RNA polymerase-binding transcription factor DksA
VKSDPRNQRRLKRIQDKGWEVAQRIAALKAGENIRISDMEGLLTSPVGETPEEKLRAWLDAINRARTRIEEERYGQCLVCDLPIRQEALDEIPWQETCARCSER